MSLYNYESEVIYEKVRGETTPQKPVYCSELIKEAIVEASPNYPQLSDYEQEWLYFYFNEYTAGEPVDLEYVRIENVKHATIMNSIPYAYKRAILKGETFVNVAQNEHHTDGISNVNLTEGRLTWGAQWEWEKLYFVVNGKPNSQYMIKYQSKDENVYICCRPETTNPQSGWVENITASNQILYTYDLGTFVISLENEIVSSDLWIQDLMIIEYKEGMENWDIPYFEGMQTVKMPVLTTTGKNLFHSDIQVFNNSNYIRTGNDMNKVCDTELKPSTTYTLSWNGNNMDGKIRLYSNGVRTSSTSIGWGHSSITFTTSEVEDGFSFYTKLSENNSLTSDMNFNVQLEEGTTTTTYEPYQTNILTVNEDLTLRSNGDVYDELNLLTGRLIQRIDENNEVLAQVVVKTVDLSTHPKPIEGVMHLESNALLSFECPVVSTGEQTLHDINSQED